MPTVIPAMVLAVMAHNHGGSFKVAFPSERSTFAMPGFVRIDWSEPSEHGQSGHGLRCFGATGEPVFEYRFKRHVNVVGNKHANWIAITDFSGSSESTVIAFRLDHPARRVNLRDELQKDPKIEPLLIENHHAYVEALSLSATGEITLKIWGYGDRSPKGFSLRKKLRLDSIQGKGF